MMTSDMKVMNIFLLLMCVVVGVDNVPIPGDCTTQPYLDPSTDANANAETGARNPTLRLRLDCTLSAINSAHEKTNFRKVSVKNVYFSLLEV